MDPQPDLTPRPAGDRSSIITSIIMGTSTSPAQTLLTRIWREQGVFFPAEYLRSQPEAKVIIGYGGSTFELLVTAFKVNGETSDMTLGRLNPIQDILDASGLDAADREDFRSALDGLGDLVTTSFYRWVHTFIASNARRTYRLQLAEPVPEMQTEVLMPWDMSIRSDHRGSEQRMEIRFAATGLTLRRLENQPVNEPREEPRRQPEEQPREQRWEHPREQQREQPREPEWDRTWGEAGGQPRERPRERPGEQWGDFWAGWDPARDRAGDDGIINFERFNLDNVRF